MSREPQEVPSAQATESKLIFHASALRSFSGPLPTPEQLQKYDQILPGAADRILSMAEKQVQHRQELERVAIKGNINAQKLGTLYGFILSMTGISPVFSWFTKEKISQVLQRSLLP